MNARKKGEKKQDRFTTSRETALRKLFYSLISVKRTGRTENVLDLVLNHLLDLFTSYLEVCSGVERCGIFIEYSADTCCHSETDIRVDVDLTYSHLSRTAELLFGDTYCVGKLAAESVDLSYVFLRNRGSTVENDRELGESLLDLFENVEAERGRNEDTLFVSCALSGCELICPWEVPIEIARESTPVRETNSSTSSGRV